MNPAFEHSGPPKAELAGVLSAPLEQVAAIALRVVPGGRGIADVGLLRVAGTGIHEVSGGPERFRMTGDGHGLTVDLDSAAIGFQGGWWYRGEYHLARHPDGTAVTHRVYNMAGPRTRWAVPLANRFFLGFTEQTRVGFTATLKALGRELNCDFCVLPGRPASR